MAGVGEEQYVLRVLDPAVAEQLRSALREELNLNEALQLNFPGAPWGGRGELKMLKRGQRPRGATIGGAELHDGTLTVKTQPWLPHRSERAPGHAHLERSAAPGARPGPAHHRRELQDV